MVLPEGEELFDEEGPGVSFNLVFNTFFSPLVFVTDISKVFFFIRLRLHRSWVRGTSTEAPKNLTKSGKTKNTSQRKTRKIRLVFVSVSLRLTPPGE